MIFAPFFPIAHKLFRWIINKSQCMKEDALLNLGECNDKVVDFHGSFVFDYSLYINLKLS